MEIITLIGFITVAGVAFFVGQNFSNSQTEKKQLEEALKEKTEELESFHSKVNNHFEKTSELFNHVSDSYQSLYDHMAQSSNQLCASPTFQALPTQKSSQTQSIDAIGTTPQEVGPYSKLKRDSDKGLFDANRLYNAHDYRNNSEQEKEEVKLTDVSEPDFSAFEETQDNKVVEINSAKEDKDAQALDYAIKEKGVINHNSLDMDDLKNS
ncbi:MAG: uncharacterized membrane-anchored protein YhcB (DUF1043 family) [Polaribacter sp.]|jgi:uncharacterized membrane-anchored protein YhcB (DUF1043 family)